MKRDGKGSRESTFSLKAMKVCDPLIRCLDLDGEGSDSCYNVKRTSQNAIIGKSWIIFPDCSSRLDCRCLGDDRHHALNPKIENMCEAGKSIGSGVECVDLAFA